MYVLLMLHCIRWAWDHCSFSQKPGKLANYSFNVCFSRTFSLFYHLPLEVKNIIKIFGAAVCLRWSRFSQAVWFLHTSLLKEQCVKVECVCVWTGSFALWRVMLRVDESRWKTSCLHLSRSIWAALIREQTLFLLH